jgi:hypothetical protein
LPISEKARKYWGNIQDFLPKTGKTEVGTPIASQGP